MASHRGTKSSEKTFSGEMDFSTSKEALHDTPIAEPAAVALLRSVIDVYPMDI